MSQSPFQKFAAKKKNSVVKEEYRQEKKKVRAEKNAYFDNLKEEKYQAMLAKRALKAGGAAKIVTANAIPKKEGAAAKADPAQKTTDVVMPLNKFLAHCGVCSRRDAIALIAEGKVKVNAEIMTEPGYKVQPTDEVIYNTKKLFVTKNLVYILLNKPKDYITTTEDPQGRRTVLQLIQKATDERVYPIGRLDRNTSGVLLLTNDGDLTQKLSHPSYEIKKIYEVKLDKNLTKTDFDRILSGLTLEDGPIYVDSLAYADSKDKSIIGIEIHSGRNRIVRRIFEYLGYDVKGLDRVMYAGLTKKNVERSKWRYLSDKEIRVLKYMNESKKKKTVREPHHTMAELTPENEITITAKTVATVAPKAPVKKKPAFPKEEKVKQPRKFKTHSEKKEFLKNQPKSNK
ncbi:MAG: pseudouridine synthase [Ferruginibacter sp.]